MKLITRDHLESWAATTFSKGTLPYLISRLVRATTPSSTKLNLPSGSATYIGGWDGIIYCNEETSYVPRGTSLWEFGTSSDPKGKADADYQKRKLDSLGFNPSESIFIFVTPRLWAKKDDWIAEKKAENYWKDIKVYDSVDIEQWLDNTLSVSRWFASQDGVGSYPFDGIITADEFWEEWSIGPKLQLMPDALVSGREYEKDLLLSTLQGVPTIKGIKASTKNEAIAFIIACAKLFDSQEMDRFFSKALLIDTEGNFRGIRINTYTPLNLIPRFDDPQPLYSAVSKGHHVLVPLGADDNFNQETITLPTIDRDGQIKSLITSGLSDEDAEKYSRESGRNITILKKLLNFPHYKAKWLEKEDIREIIPALLLGRWNESFIGDIEIIEKLSGRRYSDYSIILNRWKNLEESPLIQIGETWRLTSPLDLWTNLFTSILPQDFQSLEESFISAFHDKNPITTSREQNDFGAFFNEKKKFSQWSREGLVQSLILIGRLSNVENTYQKNYQIWVDSLIYNLLYNASGELWISVDRELPLISEASPDSFLKAVTISLSKESPEIMEMFNEEDSLFHKMSHHTGLLWALENLAWLPEYLLESSRILLKLSKLDPGGALSNRPINSITEIYKPWHFQTLANYDDRIKILAQITEQEKELGWELLLRLLPSGHEIAQPTHKMRWRMFDKATKLVYTYKEIYETHSAVVQMLIDIFDGSEEKFAQLLKKLMKLSPGDKEKILDWAEIIYPNIQQQKFIIWEEIRNTLNFQRSHPNIDWSLSDIDLERLENLYNKFEPEDVVNKYIWLFNNHWPKFPEGRIYTDDERDYQQEQERINNERSKAALIIINELGLDGALELRKRIKEIRIYGSTLAKVIIDNNHILEVCNCLYDDHNLIGFMHSFIYQKSRDESIDWIKALFIELTDKGFDLNALSNIFIPLDQNQELWDFIAALDVKLETKYWKNVQPHFYHISDNERIFGLKKLLEYKRFFSALVIISNFPKSISTNLIVETLKKAATQESAELGRFSDFEIGEIFEEIDKRDDLEKALLIHLEWLYLPILGSSGIKRNPKNLEDELAENPEFFIEVLKCVYIPEDRNLIDKEKGNINESTFANIAKQAYYLLNSWKKVPGLDDNNILDEERLINWISDVRKLAKESSRLAVADSEIGKILAQYPENVPSWPNETIFKIIDEINSDPMKRGYSSGMFNKRGFTSRAAYEGGNIERSKAKYFENLADDIRYSYPNVAEIFRNMQLNYLDDAKRMDENAERDRLEH